MSADSSQALYTRIGDSTGRTSTAKQDAKSLSESASIVSRLRGQVHF